MRTLSPNEAWEVKLLPDGEPKTVICRLCRELLFEWDRDNKSSKEAWLKGVILHYDLQHSLRVILAGEVK